MQLQETYRQAGEDKKHAATGDLQTGDPKTRNMQLQETYRQANADKKHAATGDQQASSRRQETCSYRKSTGRQEKTRNMQLQKTYRQAA
jgi:hypothetical protein